MKSEATHYSTTTGIYYKQTGTGVYMWACNQWMLTGRYDLNIKGVRVLK